MRVQLVCALGLPLLLAFVLPVQGGAKAGFEDIVKQMVQTMDTLTRTLGTIQDEETAKGARPELRKAAEKWHTIKKNAENLPPPSREERDRLAKEYKGKLEEAQKKLFVEVARVALVPGGKDALLEISGVLAKKSKQ